MMLCYQKELESKRMLACANTFEYLAHSYFVDMQESLLDVQCRSYAM